MRTLEQLQGMWNMVVLKFVRVLDKAIILKGFGFMADCASLCLKKPEERETMLSTQAENVLKEFDRWLTNQSEFLEGYFAA